MTFVAFSLRVEKAEKKEGGREKGAQIRQFAFLFFSPLFFLPFFPSSVVMPRAEMSSEEAARRARVEAFVAEACSGRPPSHGFEHMCRVAEEALRLNEEDGCPATPECVHLAAMLHDVADHKYDNDGKLAAQVAIFLKENYTAEIAEMAQRVADTVSFSKVGRLEGDDARVGITDALPVLTAVEREREEGEGGRGGRV
jgi:hypothetical protein